MSEGDFEVMPSGQQRSKHGLTARNRPRIVIEEAKAPSELRHWIRLAERFGASDDLIREDILSKSPVDEVEALSPAVAEHDDDLDEWLAGPEAEGPKLSDEYFHGVRISLEDQGSRECPHGGPSLRQGLS